MGPRPLQSKRCHSVKMLSLRHELCLSLFNCCVYPGHFPVMIGFSVEFPLLLEGVDCFPCRHRQYPNDINA